jgi:hypothetical protein
MLRVETTSFQIFKSSIRYRDGEAARFSINLAAVMLFLCYETK